MTMLRMGRFRVKTEAVLVLRLSPCSTNGAASTTPVATTTRVSEAAIRTDSTSRSATTSATITRSWAGTKRPSQIPGGRGTLSPPAA